MLFEMQAETISICVIWTSIEYKLEQRGLVQRLSFRNTCPKSEINFWLSYFKANYQKEDSEITGYQSVDAAKSPSSNYLQLTADKLDLKAGDTATFKLKSTETLSSVTMQVLSRGYVVNSQQIAMNGKEGTISFPTTAEMAPKSRIVVYAMREANKVNFSFNKNSFVCWSTQRFKTAMGNAL